MRWTRVLTTVRVDAEPTQCAPGVLVRGPSMLMSLVAVRDLNDHRHSQWLATWDDVRSETRPPTNSGHTASLDVPRECPVAPLV